MKKKKTILERLVINLVCTNYKINLMILSGTDSLSAEVLTQDCKKIKQHLVIVYFMRPMVFLKFINGQFSESFFRVNLSSLSICLSTVSQKLNKKQ